MVRNYASPAIWFGSSICGCVAYGVALAVTLAVAPRRAENGRHVVDLPWPIYAILPTLLAVSMLLVFSFWIANQRSRIYFMLVYGIAVGLCSYAEVDLLRRDFVGKF